MRRRRAVQINSARFTLRSIDCLVQFHCHRHACRPLAARAVRDIFLRHAARRRKRPDLVHTDARRLRRVRQFRRTRVAHCRRVRRNREHVAQADRAVRRVCRPVLRDARLFNCIGDLFAGMDIILRYAAPRLARCSACQVKYCVAYCCRLSARFQRYSHFRYVARPAACPALRYRDVPRLDRVVNNDNSVRVHVLDIFVKRADYADSIVRDRCLVYRVRVFLDFRPVQVILRQIRPVHRLLACDRHARRRRSVRIRRRRHCAAILVQRQRYAHAAQPVLRSIPRLLPADRRQFRVDEVPAVRTVCAGRHGISVRYLLFYIVDVQVTVVVILVQSCVLVMCPFPARRRAADILEASTVNLPLQCQRRIPVRPLLVNPRLVAFDLGLFLCIRVRHGHRAARRVSAHFHADRIGGLLGSVIRLDLCDYRILLNRRAALSDGVCLPGNDPVRLRQRPCHSRAHLTQFLRYARCRQPVSRYREDNRFLLIVRQRLPAYNLRNCQAAGFFFCIIKYNSCGRNGCSVSLYDCFIYFKYTVIIFICNNKRNCIIISINRIACTVCFGFPNCVCICLSFIIIAEIHAREDNIFTAIFNRHICSSIRFSINILYRRCYAFCSFRC